MASLLLTPPENGARNIFIINEEITSLDLAFDSSNVVFDRQGENLVISFEDGSSIVLENFYDVYTSNFLPDFVLNGENVAGVDFLFAFSENLMPAAGNENNTNSLNQSSLTRTFRATDDVDVANNVEETNSLSGNIGQVSSFVINSSSVELDFFNSVASLDTPEPTQNNFFNLTEISSGTVYGSTSEDIFVVENFTGGTVNMGGGNDVITIQRMQGGNILAGDGIDRIVVSQLDANFTGTIDGGDGHDTFTLASPHGITRAVYDNTIQLNDDGTLNINTFDFDIVNFEAIGGSSGADYIIGNSADNELYGNNGNDFLVGGKGNDRLFGGDGNDILQGGEGDDWLVGGSGDDTFRFALEDFQDGANDTIEDFGNGSDILDLSAFKSSTAIFSSYNLQFEHDATTNTGKITIENKFIVFETSSQTITLQDINVDMAEQIQQQVENGNFTITI